MLSYFENKTTFESCHLTAHKNIILLKFCIFFLNVCAKNFIHWQPPLSDSTGKFKKTYSRVTAFHKSLVQKVMKNFLFNHLHIASHYILPILDSISSWRLNHSSEDNLWSEFLFSETGEVRATAVCAFGITKGHRKPCFSMSVWLNVLWNMKFPHYFDHQHLEEAY